MGTGIKIERAMGESEVATRVGDGITTLQHGTFKSVVLIECAIWSHMYESRL